MIFIKVIAIVEVVAAVATVAAAAVGTVGDIVYDDYRDSAGAFWYKNRAIVNGEIVSMEKYIFGHEISRKRARK